MVQKSFILAESLGGFVAQIRERLLYNNNNPTTTLTLSPLSLTPPLSLSLLSISPPHSLRSLLLSYPLTIQPIVRLEDVHRKAL